MKKLNIIVFLAFCFSLLGSQKALAGITTPYIVDEKPQVLFGDSSTIDGHLGLENYIHEYIDGYLHITFTYTHNDCCFASYPPSLYITDRDPRGTTTQSIRGGPAVYPLGSRPANLTDWYTYDVQFDATGYTVIVKKGGNTEIAHFHVNIFEMDPRDITDEDWVALANQFPLNNPPNQYSMSFTPLPVKVAPPAPTTPDPVIIVPGMMGSAYKNGHLVMDPILHTYDDLIATFKANGYVEGVDLFTFPYEWRDSNALTANLLDTKISEVKAVCGCNKVDIVAHSMGGLVTRAYVQSAHYDGDVDQIIFLAVPHNGSPQAYLEWEAGQTDVDVRSQIIKSFFSAESLEKGYSSIFSYIQNRPIASVQEVLPTFDYLKENATGLLRSYPNNYPRNTFLEDLNDNISTLVNSGVRITNVIGNSGENKTIERIRVIPTDHLFFWQHGEPEGFSAIIGDNGLERGQGDNTVTTSGSALAGVVNEEVSATHTQAPGVAENRVIKILTGKDSISNIDSDSHVDVKVLLLQLLSPIDVVITAPDGKKIGKNFATGEEYSEIPGAFYSGYQTDNEYITILNPLDGQYKVEVQGTDNGGEYGVLTSYVSDSVSTTTEVSGLTNPGQVTTLDVQVDNTNPQNIEPEKVITSEVLLTDISKAYDLGWITDKKLRDKLVKKTEVIIKTEKRIEVIDGKLPDGTKKQKRIEKLEQRIDKKAAKALLIELKGYEKNKINQQAYNIIKEDLEWLINH